jgi:hypothetical protein
MGHYSLSLFQVNTGSIQTKEAQRMLSKYIVIWRREKLAFQPTPPAYLRKYGGAPQGRSLCGLELISIEEHK